MRQAKLRFQRAPKHNIFLQQENSRQKFETDVDILARPEWNIIKARQTERHPYIQQNGSLRDNFFFDGVTTNLRIGDKLLIVANEDDPSEAFLRVVNNVDLQPLQQRTKVDVSDPTISSNSEPIVSAAPVLANPISNTTQTYYRSGSEF